MTSSNDRQPEIAELARLLPAPADRDLPPGRQQAIGAHLRSEFRRTRPAGSVRRARTGGISSGLVVMAGAAATVVTIIASVVIGSAVTSSRPPLPREAASAFPRDKQVLITGGSPGSQLPESAGIATLAGMTRTITGTAPLWGAKDGTPPYSDRSLGLLGSLQQCWVLTSAIRRFGPPHHGLPMPLPLWFAARHSGPAQVCDNVWAFSSSRAPVKVLRSPAYTGSGTPGTVTLRTGSIDHGLVWQVDSAANGGMSEFRFEWALGTRLTDVRVIGASLTLAQAREVALEAHA